MLLDFLSCPGCNRKYCSAPDRDHTPMWHSYDEKILCRSCEYRRALPRRIHESRVADFVLKYLDRAGLQCWHGCGKDKEHIIGYVVEKPMPDHQCHFCQSPQESLDTVNILVCGHLVCYVCQAANSSAFYCPQCQRGCSPPGTDTSVAHFYQRHEEINQQLKKECCAAENEEIPQDIDIPKVKCSRCKKVDSIDEFWHCNDCSESICSTCCLKLHRLHNIESLAGPELAKLTKQTIGKLDGHYEGLGKNIAGLHEEMKQGLGQLVVCHRNALTKVADQSTYAAGAQMNRAMWEIAEEFEQKCDAYFPHARIYNDQLRDLKDKLEVLAKKE